MLTFDDNGFEYHPEDDDILRDDIQVAIYLRNKDSNGIKEWMESLNSITEDISSLSSGEVIVANLTFQQDASQSKIRPCVFVCADDDKALVFQITSFNPAGTKREDFQYAIQDWKRIGCKQQSWINFDHYVVAKKDDIVDKFIGKLSNRDIDGLIDKMKQCMKMHSNLKYSYDDAIGYLRN